MNERIPKKKSFVILFPFQACTYCTQHILQRFTPMVFAQWKRSMHRHRHTHTHTLSLIHILTERVQRKIHFLCRMVISPCRNCIMLNVPPDIKAVGCFALLNLTLHSPNTQRRQSKSNEFLFSCWFFHCQVL